MAVAIPCLNEAGTIAEVVQGFRRSLPDCDVYVVDNGSTDDSAARAKQAGAHVLVEKRPGKGYVVQTILEQVDADVYLLADADGSHPPADASRLLAPVLAGRADMVVGTRLEQLERGAMPALHEFGNRAITALLNFCFGTRFRDALSGYRAFSREFVKKTPVITPGFEVETELTVRALEMGMVIAEVPVSHRPRQGSSSAKLRPLRDGYRILVTIAVLLRDHRPLYLFSLVGLVSLLIGFASLLALLFSGKTGPPSLQLALLAAIGGALGIVAFAVGLILNAVNTRVQELIGLATRRVHWSETVEKHQ
jgi:glycosyltransferase involved in cell wall biosynthesis